MPKERSVPQRPLGKLLRELRRSRRLTMRELADVAGISAGYVQQLEVGLDPRSGRPIRPSPDVLRRLADPLGVTYEALMTAAGYLEESGALARADGHRRTLSTEAIDEIRAIVAETTFEVLRKRGLI
ncbi:MAG: helix-turn-helix transcriptional regulator [Chloroflexi bacterium]|nr:helix-turn-helix transcriptional regulator [Chloroflexota bacterium]